MRHEPAELPGQVCKHLPDLAAVERGLYGGSGLLALLCRDRGRVLERERDAARLESLVHGRHRVQRARPAYVQRAGVHRLAHLQRRAARVQRRAHVRPELRQRAQGRERGHRYQLAQFVVQHSGGEHLAEYLVLQHRQQLRVARVRLRSASEQALICLPGRVCQLHGAHFRLLPSS